MKDSFVKLTDTPFQKKMFQGVDRTCRPQTVKTEWIPRYYKIIKTFELTTGIGDILNTSFNLHGYPMVGTPQTALWTLENSKLDGLILENYLVMKE